MLTIKMCEKVCDVSSLDDCKDVVNVGTPVLLTMYISIIAGAWSCSLLYLLPEEGLSFKAETSQNKTGAGMSENFPRLLFLFLFFKFSLLLLLLLSFQQLLLLLLLSAPPQ